MGEHEGSKFGYGLYETLKIVKGKALHKTLHFNRINSSLKTLNMPAIDQAFFENLIHHAQDGALRISCYKDGDQLKIQSSSRNIPYSDDMYKKGYQIMISPIQRHTSNELLQHKITSNLNNYLEFLNKEVDDLIHINEKGHVTEGIYTNIFWVKAGQVYTPDIKCGCLPGIKRMWVLETLKKLGIPCNIGYYSIRDLHSADEVFLTNALMGVMPVSQFEATYYNLQSYQLTPQLMEALNHELLS